MLDVPIDFLVPDGIVSEISPNLRQYVKTYPATGIVNGFNPYDLVILDIESPENRVPPNWVRNALVPNGTLITLSWDASWGHTFSAIPRYFRSLRSKVGQQSGVPERWYFAVEPSLRKPRFLVRRGWQQLLPALSRSAFKRWFVRSGGFFLLPHHTVVIASNCNSPSPVIEMLRQLVPDTLSDEQITRCIESVYVSTTQVLLVRASYAGSTYFLQFPFSPASAERVGNQKDICEYIHQNSEFLFVPRSVNIQQSSNVICAIEEGMAGNNIERKFSNLGRQDAEEYFERALIAMQRIHVHFGSVVTMGDHEFSTYIQTKLRLIEKFLVDQRIETSGLKHLDRYLHAELTGRVVILSLTHGDFKIGNCLFDDQSNITGIVDWDMAAKNELALFDLASLRSRSIRDRTPKLSLAKLVLKTVGVPDEFETVMAGCFQTTQTDPVSLGILVWLYWIDRVSSGL